MVTEQFWKLNVDSEDEVQVIESDWEASLLLTCTGHREDDVTQGCVSLVQQCEGVQLVEYHLKWYCSSPDSRVELLSAA